MQKLKLKIKKYRTPVIGRCALFLFLIVNIFAVPVYSEPNSVDCTEEIKAACDSISIFITGNELGELRPCGCSSGQLGGFERRGAVLDAVSKDRRFVLDTGDLIKNNSEQSLVKLEIIMQAFNMLGYDVVSLTQKDIEFAATKGIFESETFSFISSDGYANNNLPRIFSKEIKLKDDIISVSVAAAGADIEDIADAANELGRFDSGRTIRILTLDGSDRFANEHLAELAAIADIIIIRADSDEPAVIRISNEGSFVISAGRLGKYVGRLDVRRPKESGRWEFSYKSVAVDANLPQAPAFVELYKTYQAIVKEQGLLEKYPKYVLPDGLQYVGSSSCGLRGCHDYEYNTAISQKHAHAFETLVKVDSDFDPECVICHSVGMDYKGGFLTEQKTPELKDVGCESCHGPGSKHLVTAGKAKTTKPQLKCLDCHTVENSANYAGREKEYCEKIWHWREPNDLDCVKQ